MEEITENEARSSQTPFFVRELSWLDFNERVLEEGLRKDLPLLERFRFLCIVSSNSDEFFMVRVSGIMALTELGSSGRDPAGMTPTEQYEAISLRTHKMVYDQYNCFSRSVCRGLAQEGLSFLDIHDLSDSERITVERYFNTILYPVLTPMAIDKSRPFPFLSNRSLNIIVELNKDGEEEGRHAVSRFPR